MAAWEDKDAPVEGWGREEVRAGRIIHSTCDLSTVWLV